MAARSLTPEIMLSLSVCPIAERDTLSAELEALKAEKTALESQVGQLTTELEDVKKDERTVAEFELKENEVKELALLRKTFGNFKTLWSQAKGGIDEVFTAMYPPTPAVVQPVVGAKIKTIEEAQAMIRAHPGIMAPIRIERPDGIEHEKVWQSNEIFDLREEIIMYKTKLLVHEKGDLWNEIKKVQSAAFLPKNDFLYAAQSCMGLLTTRFEDLKKRIDTLLATANQKAAAASWSTTSGSFEVSEGLFKLDEDSYLFGKKNGRPGGGLRVPRWSCLRKTVSLRSCPRSGFSYPEPPKQP